MLKFITNILHLNYQYHNNLNYRNVINYVIIEKSITILYLSNSIELFNAKPVAKFFKPSVPNKL